MKLNTSIYNWLQNEIEKNSNKSNKYIIELLETLIESYNYKPNNINNSNYNISNDPDSLEVIEDIIKNAIKDDDDVFIKYLIDNNIININDFKLSSSFSVNNNYGTIVDEKFSLLEFAYLSNKCYITGLLFSASNSKNKKEFLNFIKDYDADCATMFYKSNIKNNIRSAAALRTLKQHPKMLNNVSKYIIAPMLDVKQMKYKKRIRNNTKKGGKRYNKTIKNKKY